MDAISHEYVKPRREFGVHPTFEDSQAKVLNSVDGTLEGEEVTSQWMSKLVNTVTLDCIPQMAKSSANTEQFLQTSQGVSHTDGAWPAEVKTTEHADQQRLLRKVKNEMSYQNAVVNLTKTAEYAIQQNNTIDLFEDYFLEVEEEYASDPPACQTVAVFRDPSDVKRSATKISWHPDLANKVAVSYSITQFQQMPDKMPMASYIWDVNNPNAPDATVLPQSPLSCLVYNPRSPDHLVGGSYNGMLGFWDLRKGSSPVCVSDLEKSHHDPVQDCFWIQSRTGNECCSISTDGQLLWWDVRALDKGPTDSMVLEGGANDMVYGGTCMDYRAEAGATRYLMGTEQGLMLLADRKAKKDAESTKSIKSVYGQMGGRHHGPIYSIHRNPANVKYFLTVGDWTARVFMEDLKMPLMTTPYDTAYLTGGCWSPTRPGLFFTTKIDGTMDAWDYHYKQNEPLFSTKVGQSPLSSICCQSQGNMVALGAEDGTTTILSINGALSEAKKTEKHDVATMLERETKRTKTLEVRKAHAKPRGTSRGGPRAGKKAEEEAEDAEDEALLAALEKDFFAALGKGEGEGDDEDDE